jgi:hypothetical protein
MNFSITLNVRSSICNCIYEYEITTPDEEGRSNLIIKQQGEFDSYDLATEAGILAVSNTLLKKN